MANPTDYYVDPVGGNDTTGNGTIGTPWKSVQKALDTITRNGTDGDQINVKAGGDDILSSPLSIATYGTPSLLAPIIFRGYTAVAGDGGQGSISGGGTVAIIDSATNAVHSCIFADMKLHNCPSGIIKQATGGGTLFNGVFYRCELTNSNGWALDARMAKLFGCYVHNVTGIYQITASSGWVLENCFFKSGPTYHFSVGVNAASNSGQIRGCIFKMGASGTAITYNSAGSIWFDVVGNTFWANGSTGRAINFNSASIIGHTIVGNIVTGFSGAGGVGILMLAGSQCHIYGRNMFYNNTTHKTLSDVTVNLGGDVTLSADPFIDAANDDFRIKPALKALGWPTSFLGANSPAYVDPGAVQRQEAGGGGQGFFLPETPLLVY